MKSDSKTAYWFTHIMAAKSVSVSRFRGLLRSGETRYKSADTAAVRNGNPEHPFYSERRYRALQLERTKCALNVCREKRTQTTYTCYIVYYGFDGGGDNGFKSIPGGFYREKSTKLNARREMLTR